MRENIIARTFSTERCIPTECQTMLQRDWHNRTACRQEYLSDPSFRSNALANRPVCRQEYLSDQSFRSEKDATSSNALTKSSRALTISSNKVVYRYSDQSFCSEKIASFSEKTASSSEKIVYRPVCRQEYLSDPSFRSEKIASLSEKIASSSEKITSSSEKSRHKRSNRHHC